MSTSLLNRASALVSSFSRLAVSSPSSASSSRVQVRHKSLVPRRTKYRKAQKGRTPLALGGSLKGTTLEWGDYGLRVNEAVRLSAKHLEVAEAALKRGLKPIRGSKVYVPCTTLCRWLTADDLALTGTCASFPTFQSASRSVLSSHSGQRHCQLTAYTPRRATRLVWARARELLNSGHVGKWSDLSPRPPPPRPPFLPLFFCANRAKMGRVILEIGGPNLRPEMAHAGASRFSHLGPP